MCFGARTPTLYLTDNTNAISVACIYTDKAESLHTEATTYP